MTEVHEPRRRFLIVATLFVPAPTNLIIPPHQYLENRVLEIGSDGSTS